MRQDDPAKVNLFFLSSRFAKNSTFKTDFCCSGDFRQQSTLPIIDWASLSGIFRLLNQSSWAYSVTSAVYYVSGVKTVSWPKRLTKLLETVHLVDYSARYARIRKTDGPASCGQFFRACLWSNSLEWLKATTQFGSTLTMWHSDATLKHLNRIKSKISFSKFRPIWLFEIHFMDRILKENHRAKLACYVFMSLVVFLICLPKLNLKWQFQNSFF